MTYSTSFPSTENPISEGGNWVNGAALGVDWTNCRTTPGLCFGTEAGTGAFDDSIAMLLGTWGPSQTVQGTARIVSSDSGQFEEIELHTRWSLSAHNATGYEFIFSVKSGNPYVQIVRWDGSLGGFTLLDARTGPGVNNGDLLKATSVGNTHTLFVNGSSIFSVTDGTFSTGNPGLGMFLQNGGGTGTMSNYGFSSYSATDGIVTNVTNRNKISNLRKIISSRRIKF